MQDSIYDFVMERLAATKGDWVAIAEAAGVSHRTVEKIARREIVDPKVSNIEKLARYFREQQTTI